MLSILLIISVVVAGFFAYQTQKLVKEIQGMRNEELVKQTLTLDPTSTPDPTANWKTYTNQKLGFSFNYPGSFRVEEIDPDGFIKIITLAETVAQGGISIEARLQSPYDTYANAKNI